MHEWNNLDVPTVITLPWLVHFESMNIDSNTKRNLSKRVKAKHLHFLGGTSLKLPIMLQ